ncbi:hypothetical protein TBLA_0I00840 [Henningerozyma blattae CBS 6284]|uniref:V-type proton ATPase subunit H n=1 Tax=Henningerozyma blattae (strain ATCC 34711 / CBS 6284 / DSM 70876 / NBRC 10599 / NRRL Y-10934 / UCD 77-7) TaxID=1071380 RepID=I2H8P1_HENB6|nr:hypothetical protein TBLA_0I00840 [Tetrapisispora blattae CBS 6284]CCH62743.1 hypothetical protein TBLA_0I00840 [Tetrapisispora blattae CBS 6284]
MILLDSTHFMEIHNAISLRNIQWDNLAMQRDISETDVSIIKKLEKILIKHAAYETPMRIDESIILPMIHFLKNSNDVEANKCVINLFTELFTSQELNFNGETIEFFQKNPTQLKELFQVSLQGDDQTVLIGVFNIVSLLVEQGSLLNVEIVDGLLNSEAFVRILVNIEQMETSYVCMRLLQELAAVKSYRKVIWKHQTKFVPTIFQIISRALDSNNSTKIIATNSNNLGIQMQYHCLLLLWLLTFDKSIAYEITQQYIGGFLNLLKLVNVTIKEKISRVCISIILQCCDKRVENHKLLIKQLILLGNGLNILNSLGERKKYSDEELREDMGVLRGILEDEYKELTSFDEYVAEVDSKLMCWSPPHVDNGFWSDNVDKFKSDNWKLFKKLIRLLVDTTRKAGGVNDKESKVVIEVLLNDITHVIQLLPESIDVLRDENCKIVIMELLTHSDSRVKYEALKTTQAMIGYTI